VWNYIRSLSGASLRTLDKGRSFDVTHVGDTSVTVRPHATGTERSIERDAVERAFEELAVRGELTRAEIQERYSSFNPAYVAAMLAEVPGVRVALRPIRLFYKAPEKVSDPGSTGSPSC
jgi:hypothetical protein